MGNWKKNSILWWWKKALQVEHGIFTFGLLLRSASSNSLRQPPPPPPHVTWKGAACHQMCSE